MNTHLGTFYDVSVGIYLNEKNEAAFYDSSDSKPALRFTYESFTKQGMVFVPCEAQDYLKPIEFFNNNKDVIYQAIVEQIKSA